MADETTAHECCWHQVPDHRAGERCCHCGSERGRHGAYAPLPLYTAGVPYWWHGVVINAANDAALPAYGGNFTLAAHA